MELHVALGTEGSLRSQLERQLRDGIRCGRLKPGARLPPSRALAGELGVSRGVVLDAYSQLLAEGYLVARQGSGTRVAGGIARAAASEPRPAVDTPTIRYEMRSGLCDVSFFPRRAWQGAGAAAVRELPDAWLRFGRPRGFSRLRVALADYLGRARAAVGEPHAVIVCSGLSHGLVLVWRALREQGARRVVVEDPCWPRHPESVRLGGLEPVPVAVDGSGLVVDELERLAVDAVLVSPAHQYPTGVVLAPERRAALIDWARRSDALIVEDDYDAEYRYDREPVAALQGLAPERIVYAGTASKTLAPAVRLAWLHVPDWLLEAVTSQQELLAAQPPALEQATLAIMLERGEFERHLRHTRRRYRVRRDVLAGMLAEQLPDARTGGVAAGLHLVAWLPDGADEAAIAERALERAVAIHTLHGDCAVSRALPPALLLGYAALPEDALRRAARLLGEAYDAC
jgi:GntR family transcriptional regulator/MocR family aminotransferase